MQPSSVPSHIVDCCCILSASSIVATCCCILSVIASHNLIKKITNNTSGGTKVPEIETLSSIVFNATDRVFFNLIFHTQKRKDDENSGGIRI